jgi:hypothetical protein
MNIDRYRALLSAGKSDAAQRKIVETLLADAEERLETLSVRAAETDGKDLSQNGSC